MTKNIQIRVHDDTHKRLRMHCLSMGISVQKLIGSYIDVVAMMPPGESEIRKKLCADLGVISAREQEGEYEHLSKVMVPEES